MGQERLPGLQVARAVAALGIVYFHSWVTITRFPANTDYPIYWLKTYGWLSIDLFFAISGFVIALVVDRETFSPRTFFIKRMFRIYPLWLVLLTVFAICAGLWRGFEPTETFDFFLYSATLLPTHGFPFYNIGWTLQHEMAFYALAALVVPLFGLRGLAVVLLCSTLGGHYFDLHGIFGEIAAHHAEFLAGLMVYLLRNQIAKFGFIVPFAVGAALLGYWTTHDEGRLFPFALFLLVAAFVNLKRVDSIPQRIGDTSYSLYLIHPLIFMIASGLVSRFPNLPIWSEEPIRFACISIAIGFAFASWKWFERPMIAIGNKLTSDDANDMVHSDRGLNVVVRRI
jgi:exopolysaccharide production protein ExoZ